MSASADRIPPEQVQIQVPDQVRFVRRRCGCPLWLDWDRAHYIDERLLSGYN